MHKKLKPTVKVFLVLLVAAAVFTWIGWFATNPHSFVARLSTFSLGLGLALGVWFLVGVDQMARTRLARFVADLVIGGVMVTLIYLFMLGLNANWVYIAMAFGAVFGLAALFALRRV